MFSQETTLVIGLIETVLDACYLSYLLSAVVISMTKLAAHLKGVKLDIKASALGRWVNRIWYWCKWPALVYLILDPFFAFVLGQHTGWLYWLFEALGFYNWMCYKDVGDDDDEFKKQFKKAAEKIIESGGKLIVVPESA